MSTLSLTLIGLLVVTVVLALRTYYDRAHRRDYVRALGWCLLAASLALSAIYYFTPRLIQ